MTADTQHTALALSEFDIQPDAGAQSLMIRRRYKVVRVVSIEPGYAAVEAVDIAERETPERLLNLYEGELFYRYGRIYAGLSRTECPAFHGMFLEGETLVAVFDNCYGESIDLLFHRGDRWSWEERLGYAHALLFQAMTLTNLPPEVGCAALLSENVYADAGEQKIRLRYMIRPMEEMNARELTLLAGDQVRKILPLTLRSTDAERAFTDCLCQGAYRTPVELYAAWRKAEPVIREEREEFEKAFLFRRGWILFKRWIRQLRERGGQE